MSGELAAINHYWMEIKNLTSQIQMPFEAEILLDTMEVARSLETRDILVKCENISAGDTLLLKREPENRFDSFAIRVETVEGMNIGYAPREKNRILARLMDAGKLIVAKVRDKQLVDEFFISIWMEVFLKEI